MKMRDIKCRLCGQTLAQASTRGAFIKRVSPIGSNFVGECRPSCDRNHGNRDDAILAALAGGKDE